MVRAACGSGHDVHQSGGTAIILDLLVHFMIYTMCPVSTSTVVTGTSIISDPIDSQLVQHHCHIAATPILLLNLDQAVHPHPIEMCVPCLALSLAQKYIWWKPHLSL